MWTKNNNSALPKIVVFTPFIGLFLSAAIKTTDSFVDYVYG